jgi:Tol biopolymer transport system component
MLYGYAKAAIRRDVLDNKGSIGQAIQVKVTILFGLIGVLPVLGACSANSDIVLTENTPSAGPTITATSQTMNPLAQSPTVDAIVESTLLPISTGCAGGFIAFEIYGSANSTVAQSGVYLACSDGTFSQRILEESTTGLSASPNHTQLAVVDYKQIGTGHIQLLNLSSYSLREVVSHLPSAWNIRWSSDSEYVGYLRGEDNGLDTHLEIFHIGSQTTSQVLSGKQILSFDWSPDGKHLVFYILSPNPDGAGSLYVADIHCDSILHECTLNGQKDITFASGGTYYSWTRDSNDLTYARGSHIRTIGLDGNIIQDIDVSTLDPTIQEVTELAWAPDGIRIAFLTSQNADNVYLLNTKEMSLLDLTKNRSEDVKYPNFAWLP